MSITKQEKEKLKTAFMKQFDNPKELGQILIEKEKDAMKEMIDDNKSAYGYPDSIKSDELINHLEMFIESKIDGDEWVDFAEKESSYDLSEPSELEELSNNDNDIVDLILMNFDGGCYANILLPDYEDYMTDSEMPENFKDEIEKQLRETPPNEFKEMVKLYSDKSDIEEALKRAGEQEGIPQDKISEIEKYDIKDIRSTIPLSAMASRYKTDAQKEGVKSFLENNLVKALVVDGLVTYNIEILENPEDL